MMKTIQVQLAIKLDEAAAKTLAELLAPAIKQAVGATTDEDVEKKNARLRASQHAIFGGEKPPEDQGLLIDSKEAAKLLKVSPRTLWRMQSAGGMPAPTGVCSSTEFAPGTRRRCTWGNPACLRVGAEPGWTRPSSCSKNRVCGSTSSLGGGFPSVPS